MSIGRNGCPPLIYGQFRPSYAEYDPTQNQQSLSVCLVWSIDQGDEVHGGRTRCWRVTVLRQTLFNDRDRGASCAAALASCCYNCYKRVNPLRGRCGELTVEIVELVGVPHIGRKLS